jgi:hypothetical protein
MWYYNYRKKQENQKRKREVDTMITPMNKEREEMIDKVIGRYGFEARETINFARVCERSIDDVNVRKVFEALMK